MDALPRRGMRVRCIAKKDIHEAMEARQMIELFSVPYAIARAEADPAFLEKLEENLRENERLLQDIEDVSHYSEKAMEELLVSQEFHRILVKAIGNAVILESYQNIINHQYVYYQHNKDKREELLASLGEHKRIYQGLKAGDEAATRAAILAHLKLREEEAAGIVE